LPARGLGGHRRLVAPAGFRDSEVSGSAPVAPARIAASSRPLTRTCPTPGRGRRRGPGYSAGWGPPARGRPNENSAGNRATRREPEYLTARSSAHSCPRVAARRPHNRPSGPAPIEANEHRLRHTTPSETHDDVSQRVWERSFTSVSLQKPESRRFRHNRPSSLPSVSTTAKRRSPHSIIPRRAASADV